MNAHPSSLAPMAGTDLLTSLLREERQWTAVDEFARIEAAAGTDSEHRERYRALLPLKDPAPGEQYAFEVDLDRCSGCKACVTACHSLNGLDEEESWREVFNAEARTGGGEGATLVQHVTTACHHCAEPGCMRGCPVEAYDKDPITGVVRHLDDQCIGCQYCVLMCPYDVPRYSNRLGIVRKCDMCSQRLREGEAPACAQACPHEAIRITVAPVHGGERVGLTPLHAPASLTQPSTRYITARPLAGWRFVPDAIAPAEPHRPLQVLLIFTQLAAGIAILSFIFGINATAAALMTVISAALGLGVGTLHLGQPLRAWKSFLAWRTSWFSREVIAFGAFFPAAIAWLGSLVLELPVSAWVHFMTAATGLAGVFCSVMIYAKTTRPFWHGGATAFRFFGTTILLGVAALGCLAFEMHPALIAAIVAPVAMAKLILEGAPLAGSAPGPLVRDVRSAGLLRSTFRVWSQARLLLLGAGGVVLPLVNIGAHSMGVALLSLGLLILSECIERNLFFRAVIRWRDQGGWHA